MQLHGGLSGFYFLKGGKRLIIKRIFNNNVVLAETEKHEKRMLLGKGIGFNRRVNGTIRREDADEVYVLESTQNLKDVEELVKSVPADHLILTSKIVEMAQEALRVRFDNVIYIGLADHISYAVTRAQQGEYLSNAILWEIKKFYPLEFKVALKALDMIKASTGIALNEDEAGFIAIHFVNAQQSGKTSADSKAIMQIMQDVVNIVQYHFGMEFAEDSFNYMRFITHLRFFLQRVDTNRQEQTQEDDFLFEQIKHKYPEAYQCTLKIKRYIKQKLQAGMIQDEELYMMLHIQWLTQREKKLKD